MSTLRVIVKIKKNGQPLPGFPLEASTTVTETQPFTYPRITANDDADQSFFGRGELTTLQAIAIATQGVPVSFTPFDNGTGDQGGTLLGDEGATLVVLGCTITVINSVLGFLSTDAHSAHGITAGS